MNWNKPDATEGKDNKFASIFDISKLDDDLISYLKGQEELEYIRAQECEGMEMVEYYYYHIGGAKVIGLLIDKFERMRNK